MDSREQFEAWAVSRGLKPERWLVDPRVYVTNEIQDSWMSWQAARSAAIQECADIAFKADTNWDAREQILALNGDSLEGQ